MAYGSYIFNGTDEYLSRTMATTSPATALATISFWVKTNVTTAQIPMGSTFGEEAPLIIFDNDTAFEGGGTRSYWLDFFSEWDEAVATLPAANTWEHWVFRWDSGQATAANRIRIYKNGTLQTGNSILLGEVALNQNLGIFENTSMLIFGDDGSLFFPYAGKLAFIDVVQGASLDATSFAFNNGGTWTHMDYAGSYGTYGFRLDGSAGFNDAGPNGQNFTGNNMTEGANIDLADLPPYLVAATASFPPILPRRTIAAALRR